jgi:ABC-type sulfate/molybdate transport systems ATPase subunit
VTGASPLLELRDVAVVAGGRTILGLDHLALAPGETLCVLGANGAGKSTLLRVAGGLRTPARGELRLDGVPATAPQIRAVTAAVLQRPLLRRGATARTNVETGLRFARVPREERRRRTDEWLVRLDLAGLADRRASALSGGEAQRVSIARALVLAPRILLLDEPFSALDAPTRAELLADLRDVLASIGAASLLVTHDRHEAAAIADRVAILHAGELRQLGPTASVLEHPADADCARLLGFENLLEPRLASRLLGEPARHRVAVRARDVAVVPGGDMGVVERVLPFGERTRIATRVDGVRVLSDVRDPRVAAGDRVDLRAAVAAARVIAPG